MPKKTKTYYEKEWSMFFEKSKLNLERIKQEEEQKEEPLDIVAYV